MVRTELTRAHEFSEYARNKDTAQIKIEGLFLKYGISRKEGIYIETEDIEIDDP